MALSSPGTDITLIDESFYVPAAAGTVPLIIVASAQDKTDGSGAGTASGTTALTANVINLVGSQRELTSLFGNPTFYSDTSGSSLHGYEANEYGLMAAYSFLGVSNRAYVVRADVDLAELEASATAPVGTVADGTYWFDTAATLWGVFEWDATNQVFANNVPVVITDVANISVGKPIDSTGPIGTYAVDATTTSNKLWYKNSVNAWVQVGGDDWKKSIATITGSISSPVTTVADQITINGTTVALSTGQTLAANVTDINNAAIQGITAAAINNRLEIYADDSAQGAGDSTTSAEIIIANASGTPLASLGITAGTFYNPRVEFGAHYNVPQYKTNDTTPRPTGSVWVKTTTPNSGADFKVKLYNTTTKTWTTVSAPLYADRVSATYGLDATSGGAAIAAGALYVETDITDASYAATGISALNASAAPLGDFKIFRHTGTPTTKVTGGQSTPAFSISDAFTIQSSSAGSGTLSAEVEVTLLGTDATAFVTAVSLANPANVVAAVETSGAVSLTHSEGGEMVFRNTNGSPLGDAGISNALDNVVNGNNSDLVASGWLVLTYEAKASTPSTDPANGTLWYNSVTTEVDILINDGSAWRGYQGITDVRGYALTACSPNGPIVQASEPTLQSDSTALVAGDIWIDTSDTEEYMTIWRHNGTAFVALDTTDQTTENGVEFADVRYNTDQADNVAETIVNLLTSDYVDPDAPDPAIYPTGMLLVNTRRSGYNVKEYKVDFYNETDYPANGLTEKNQWTTRSTNNIDGSGSFGRKAQRSVVVAAMKSTVDSTSSIREEQRAYNLIAAPGYPELIANMVALNNERKNTAFVMGDSPFRLAATSTAVQNWANNAASASDNGEDGLITSDEYLSVHYPSGLTTDLEGNTIVVPPTHMMLRTFAQNDAVAYQWFAPAGMRRGVIDNATSIGYLTSEDEFQVVAVQESLRDTLHSVKVNALTFMPGAGLMSWGNLTRAPLASAMDRINVARLINYIRVQVDVAVKPYIFEPNDKLTRDEVKQSIESIMNELTTQRGLNDFLIVCDESNNTSSRIDRNELWVDIAIEPVKSVEFIFIPIRIKNTGEIAGL